MNEDTLKSLWTYAQTEEELTAGLQMCDSSPAELQQLAADKGWKPGPYVIAHLFSSGLSEEATPEFIDQVNKASLRRLQTMMAVVTAHVQAALQDKEASPGLMLDYMEQAVKIQTQLTKMEMPIWGLTTAEPITIQNPINIFMDQEAIDERSSK